MDSALVLFFMIPRRENRKQLISEIIYFELFLVFIFLIVSIFFKDFILGMIKIEINGIYEILILQVPFVLLMNFCQNIFRWTFERKLFIITSVSYLTAILVYCLIGVYYSNFDLHQYFLGSLVIQIFFSIISLYLILPGLKNRPNYFF